MRQQRKMYVQNTQFRKRQKIRPKNFAVSNRDAQIKRDGGDFVKIVFEFFGG